MVCKRNESLRKEADQILVSRARVLPARTLNVQPGESFGLAQLHLLWPLP